MLSNKKAIKWIEMQNYHKDNFKINIERGVYYCKPFACSSSHVQVWWISKINIETTVQWVCFSVPTEMDSIWKGKSLLPCIFSEYIYFMIFPFSMIGTRLQCDCASFT